MGTNPTKAADNIYCKYRKAAAKYNDKLNSREGAAELLGLSVSSLSDYELGNTKVVPVDKVVLMADLYNAPEIKNYYCTEVCPLGYDSPKIVMEDIDRISVRALASFRKIAGAKDKLLDIVEDGLITEDEKPELEELLSVLDEITSITQTLKLWAEKNMR